MTSAATPVSRRRCSTQRCRRASPPMASTSSGSAWSRRPMVAFVAQRLGALGAMVSASHNPYRDNGIKLFAAGGTKLSDEVESAIERELDALQTARRLNRAVVGRSTSRTRRRTSITSRLAGHRQAVARRCGSSSTRPTVRRTSCVREVFERLGADVIVIGDAPNGTQHQRRLRSDRIRRRSPLRCVEHGADLGIALDGDADRLIAVDHAGAIVDGDHIIAICRARHAARRGAPPRHRRRHRDDQPRLPPGDARRRHRRRHHRRRRPVRARGARCARTSRSAASRAATSSSPTTPRTGDGMLTAVVARRHRGPIRPVARRPGRSRR